MNTTTKTPTKAERKQAQLNRHYIALHELLKVCGIDKPIITMRHFSGRLLQMEKQCHQLSTGYCNGDITTEQWERITDERIKTIQKWFGGKLQGLFINGDARGYALKINDKQMSTIYAEIGLQRDWGGYGLLAPEIDGN